MKQTAVEWLIGELQKTRDYQRVINEANQSGTSIRDVIKQAKEMEFEQRKKDFVNDYKARAKASKLIFVKPLKCMQTKPLNHNRMKNIHLLPTEKPSRIRLGNNGNFVIANFKQSSIRSKNDSYTNQHIYITFDEEIKVGEYVIDLENNEVFISLGKIGVNNYIKKIILATDQDLIADGVQSIDDEFLEWFVKNRSCEFVEVQKWTNYSEVKYKLIIPQEEPKCTCSKGKGIDFDEMGLAYCVLCKK